MKKEYSLEIKNLNKIYENGFQAIFNTNVSIKKGEFAVFVGPSGCGKTTTLRAVAGLDQVSSGQIFINGEDVTTLNTRYRNISMVFQNYALFPQLSVKDNIAFGLKVKKYPKHIIAEKVAWAASILGLEEYLNRKPKQLSGGQRQRVALGRAIVGEPSLFMMDEPLSNLDAKLRAKMRVEIRRLHDKLKTTTVYVTHDQIEAMTMADKIIVMNDGFVQQIGSPAEVFDSPSNTFVASFIGTPPMNLIEGEFSKGMFISKNKKLKVEIPTSLTKGKNIPAKVIFGIRPGDYSQVSTKPLKGKSTITGTVLHSELIGKEKIVSIKTSSSDEYKFVISREDSFKDGQKVFITLKSDKMHLFDAETTITVTSKNNDQTQKALDSWINSTEDIKRRKAVMAKEINKGNRETLIKSLILKRKHKKELKEEVLKGKTNGK